VAFPLDGNYRYIRSLTSNPYWDSLRSHQWNYLRSHQWNYLISHQRNYLRSHQRNFLRSHPHRHISKGGKWEMWFKSGNIEACINRHYKTST